MLVKENGLAGEWWMREQFSLFSEYLWIRFLVGVDDPNAALPAEAILRAIWHKTHRGRIAPFRQTRLTKKAHRQLDALFAIIANVDRHIRRLRELHDAQGRTGA
jgi:hypothetical protein